MVNANEFVITEHRCEMCKSYGPAVGIHFGGVTICDARGMKEDNPRLIAGQVGIEELQKYQGEDCNICAWHIDKPVMIKGIYHIEDFGLKRPPQSWCYTEVCVK